MYTQAEGEKYLQHTVGENIISLDFMGLVRTHWWVRRCSELGPIILFPTLKFD